MLCSREFWPIKPDVLGLTFLNRTVYYPTKDDGSPGTLTSVPHNPEFMHRSYYNFNHDPEAMLSDKQIALILDCGASNAHQANLLRLVWPNFLCMCPGYGSAGVFLNGDPGSAKSSIIRTLQTMLPASTSSIDPKSLRGQNFHMYALVKGKEMIVVPDMSPKTITANFEEFVKTVTGRDR